MSQKDYYDTLGIGRDASQQAIRDAYRKLAFQYHPDRNNEDPAATEKMKDINEAYAVLSDVTKRREYDFLRSQYGASAYQRFRQSHSADDIFEGSDISQIFEEFARTFGFRSSGDIFRESYGAQYRSSGFRRAGMFGGSFIFYPRAGRTGEEQPAQDSRLPLPEFPFPGVLGKLTRFLLKAISGVELPQRGKDWYDTVSLNPENARDGAEVEYSYRKWGMPKNLMVKVPPEIRDGQRIRLKGMGSPGKAGGEPGDLYLQVQIRRSLAQRLKGIFKA